jgi:DNA-directed RNA polymerase subunit RPC12/RpoP
VRVGKGPAFRVVWVVGKKLEKLTEQIEQIMATIMATITRRCLCRRFGKVVAKCAECGRPICENHWWVAGRPYCTRCGYRLFLKR